MYDRDLRCSAFIRSLVDFSIFFQQLNRASHASEVNETAARAFGVPPPLFLHMCFECMLESVTFENLAQLLFGVTISFSVMCNTDTIDARAELLSFRLNHRVCLLSIPFRIGDCFLGKR